MAASLEQYEQADELSKSDWEDWRNRLQDRYRFYIMNPASRPGVNYSFWIQDGGEEYPVVNSNTGGFTSFNSKSKGIGDGIEPTDEFLSLVGYGAHEAMCFMPDLYFDGDHFERLYTSLYDEKPREYEVWAAHVLIHWMVLGDELIPELAPLARWADKHTEFGIPILGKGGDA